MVRDWQLPSTRFIECVLKMPLNPNHPFIHPSLNIVRAKSSQICCFYNVNKHVGYEMNTIR